MAGDRILVPVDGSTSSLVAEETAAKIAKKTGATITIMGSRGLGKGKRFLFGSISEDVSHKARCSVLIVPAKA